MSYFHLNFILKGKLTVCCLLMLAGGAIKCSKRGKADR